uniref:F-actin-capping protein subunit alpha n=1 Tax=Oryza punctata TaxID=4537 RepID=A0A0E0LJP5_ORYPU
MSDGEELSDRQKREIAVWFLSNAPAGEIHYVAKGKPPTLPLTLAIQLYNPIIITTYGELNKNNYLDPRTAQVATVDHIKQVMLQTLHVLILVLVLMPAMHINIESLKNCTKLRPAADEELPSAYIEDFRSALDVELSKYVGEAYPKGVCAVYCTSGKDIEGPGADFGLAVVISAAKRSPQNFCFRKKFDIPMRSYFIFNFWIRLARINGSWRSIWTLEFSDGLQFVEIKGKIQVGAHYFEEGNVQLDTNIDCKDSTILQSPEECAVSITNIIRHHESEYLSSLEESYLNLSDATFKDLRRKLPVTRTLFPWHNTLALSLTRDLTKELAIGK